MTTPTRATSPSGLWPSRWPAEDAGPSRLQHPWGGTGLALLPGEQLTSTSRLALACTMVVLRDPGEAYLLCHTGGDEAVAWVEQIDPVTLECVRRSPDLAGGPTWPGGLAAHADGSIQVVFGRHAHRLSAALEIEAASELPRDRPYNSFVALPDGHLVTKDFGGRRPGAELSGSDDCELLLLAPDTLAVVATCTLPERSIARLSADGDDVYVVGTEHLWRVRRDGATLSVDTGFRPRYRTIEGQTYGWDAVIVGGAAWFLDNGEGSERYAGTFRGQGTNTAPLHLVRVDLADASVQLVEVCGLPGGLIANPPAVDVDRRIAVGYDSGNGVVTAFHLDGAGRIERMAWQRTLNHAAHPLRYADTGELVLLHHDPERGSEQAVVLDIVTGAELGRADTGSPVQSVVFTTAGFGRAFYVCSFTTVSRIAVA